MARAPLILSVMALALSALALLQVQDRVPADHPASVGLLSSGDARLLLDRVDVLEQRLASNTPHLHGAVDAAPKAPARLLGNTTTAPRDAQASRAHQKALLARIEALETALQGVDEEAPRRDEEGRLWLGDPRDIARAFKLNPQQIIDVRAIVAGTRKSLSELHNLKSDEGPTPMEAALSEVEIEGGGTVTIVGANPRLNKIMDSSVPGRRETYRQAQSLILNRAVRRILEVLDPSDAQEFKRANTPALFGAL